MAKFDVVRRILKADFPSNYHDLLDRLLYPLNQFLEATIAALNNGLTVKDNMAAMEVDIPVVNDVSDQNPILFRTTLRGPPRGIICISAETLQGSPPTSQPFLTFVQAGSNIRVTGITGLVSGSRYNLRLYVFS